ncbi:MAG TPA: sugar phosphate isomerase/epimerase family protein [Phycisphaerales bacterium]|nr:sugar phosphate isomerase/epimerase family protein [Phycisphaerales bacterium]
MTTGRLEPNSGVSRRTFIATSLAAATLAACRRDGPASQALDKPSDYPADRSFSISLAQWSLNKTLKAGFLDHLDFPAVAKQEYGIDAVEYVNTFFRKKNDAAYNAELRRRCDDAGVRSLLIMCDGEGSLGDADPVKRLKAVENHYKWVEAGKALGCHSIRVNALSSGTWDQQQERAADGLRRLCVFADDHGLNVIVENHWGLSSNGRWLTGVMKRVNHPRVGTLPDFGNFDPKEYDRYQGVAEMMPWAKGVSAKSYDFDAETGEAQVVDFHRMMKIVLNAGYHGYVGIEYEGKRLSESEGIKATKRLLERIRSGGV